ncbi:MAG: DUF885 domain-containing protein [Myxococcaceae bacterium]|nr:DUF885 domain-containing protein [Myxococcaceae bacterium]
MTRFVLLLLVVSGCATTTPAARREAAAKQLLEVLGRADPESITLLGLGGFEGDARDYARPVETDVKALEDAADTFAEALRTERDRETRIDLQILETTARRIADRARVSDRLVAEVPNLSRTVYEGLQPGLSPGASESMKAGALARLKRYAGPAFIDVAIAQTRRELASDRVQPWRGQIESRIKVSRALDAEAVKLVTELNLPETVELAAQLTRWELFLENEVLPKARDDFRPPPEIYAHELKEQGIDLAPDVMAAEAHAAFDRTFEAWSALAKQLGSTDPAALLAKLKQRRLTGDALLARLKESNGEIEAIVRREKLLTLPERAMAVRFMDASEAARSPVPTIDVAGFVQGQKEIALLVPPEPAAGAPAVLDDFNFEAAALPLCSHEGRPGHELQFTHAAERGLSVTRTLFAFNTVNIEGWALYAERLVRPHLSAEARFVSLQYLLIRQARAFLEPELVLGKIDESKVREVLGLQLGASAALVESELRRYQFESRGQAPAYFVGLQKLERLRADVEAKLGEKFDAQRFHDAVLDQGFVPLSLLADGVLADLAR